MDVLMTSFVFSSAGVLHRSRREEGGGAHGQKKAQSLHQSVMSREVLEYLAPHKGELVIDATAGQGGHTALFVKKGAKVIALDADEAAVAMTKARAPRAAVINANFGDLADLFAKEAISHIDKALFDLGWNRGQLEAGRGFSFRTDEPLSMSYGPQPRSGFDARAILNTWSEKAIADVLFGYGEERYARRIARAIVARREAKPIETTIELVEIIRDAVPAAYRRAKLHPATKSFQALRIAVNDELKTIEGGLHAAWKHLACEGRIAVITFHSIEDRLVKQLFLEFVKKGGALVVKKPVVPAKSELMHNPSARSAKLRVIEKTCTPTR